MKIKAENREDFFFVCKPDVSDFEGNNTIYEIAFAVFHNYKMKKANSFYFLYDTMFRHALCA